MRYEHIELDISTAACAALREALTHTPRTEISDIVAAELMNLDNELRARLQRRDVDPHCLLNTGGAWLEQ